jgi:hydroxymethylpyrimidine pyrophosphatase-like HAD family hydrolase
MRRPAPGLGLVAVDLDGTLVDPSGQVSARSIVAVQRVRQAGVPVIVATGRGWIVTERTLAALGGADFAICSNGALVTRLADHTTLRDEFLPDRVATAIIGRLRAALPGVGLGLEIGAGAKAEAGFGRRLPAGVPIGRTVADIGALVGDGRAVRKVIVFHDDYDDRIDDLATVVGSAIEAIDGVHVQHSGLPFLEVGPVGVDKATALAFVCDLLSVARETVVAFGDDVNDISMLRWAGTGVAMGNAVERARAAADVVTAGNDDDGVARYLEHLLAGDDPSDPR